MDTFQFTASGIFAILILAALTVIPVKIGAVLFNAGNNSLIYCIVSVIAGTIATLLLFSFVGGFMGLLLSYIAVSMIYWKALELSFAWSFMFTFAVMAIQIGLFQVLNSVVTF